MTTKEEMAFKAKRTLAMYEAKIAKMEAELARAVEARATLTANIAYYEQQTPDNAVRPKPTPKRCRQCGQ